MKKKKTSSLKCCMQLENFQVHVGVPAPRFRNGLCMSYMVAGNSCLMCLLLPFFIEVMSNRSKRERERARETELAAYH